MQDIKQDPKLLIRLSFLFGSEVEDYKTIPTDPQNIHPNVSEILVISNGECYIIDRNKEKSICDFGYDFKQVIEFNDKFILIGTRNIAIVESSEKIERFRDLCWDFIEDIKIENGILSGVLNDFNGWDKYDKTKFSIDLKTNELIKSKKKFKTKVKFDSTKAESKKWWEIWK